MSGLTSVLGRMPSTRYGNYDTSINGKFFISFSSLNRVDLTR